MKGVLLAGGLGTRLLPMTRVTNKHLLPVYNRPMICYPLQQFVHAGITDVLVVTGAKNKDDFLSLLGDGHEFGLKHLHYTHQEGHGGIADALLLAEVFAAGGPVAVLLGDNIFQDPLEKAISDFQVNPDGAVILLKEVDDPERFGVATIDGDRVASVAEKPREPDSRLAVTGCYLYDNRVFDVIRTLEPSQRGELEITDVNNQYIKWGAMKHHILTGWWTDAGTVASLHRAGELVAADQGNPVLVGRLEDS